jgi:hypothetical protein
MTVERAARDAARSIRRTPEAVVKAAGQEIGRELNLLAKAAVGGDQKMSNLRNIRIGAKVTVTRWGRGARADVEPSSPRARAPWRWLTDGTKPHQVPRNLRRFQGGELDRRGARTKGKRARLLVNGSWRTGPWQVRGVQGRGLWWRPMRSAGPKREALRAFNEEMRRG